MGYCTIEETRDFCGVHGTFKRNAKLSPNPDGANKTFYIPYNYIVDGDSDEDAFDVVPDYTDDITVYDDGTSVAVTSVDTRRGIIVLNAAPAAESVMTVDYTWSKVRDQRIVAIINRVDAQIDRVTRSKGSSVAFTEYWDGDGSKKRFLFKRWPVTNISSLTVDTTTTYVLGTDYWLYPNSSSALWIEFLAAPAEDHQNVVIIYDYGTTNQLINKLSLYMSARELIQEQMGSSAGGKSTYTGDTLKPGAIAANKMLSMILRIDEEIKRLWSQIGGRNEVGVIS